MMPAQPGIGDHLQLATGAVPAERVNCLQIIGRALSHPDIVGAPEVDDARRTVFRRQSQPALWKHRRNVLYTVWKLAEWGEITLAEGISAKKKNTRGDWNMDE